MFGDRLRCLLRLRDGSAFSAGIAVTYMKCMVQESSGQVVLVVVLAFDFVQRHLDSVLIVSEARSGYLLFPGRREM